MAKPLFSRSAIAYRSLSGAVLLCLGLLIWDTQNPQTLQPVRSLLHQITSPASSLGAFFNQNTNQIGANLKSRQELYRENLSLKAELAAANLYLQQNAQQASELAQLSGIYTRPLQLPGSVQLAGVVGIDNNPLRHIFVINKGARDEVYVGQTVLDNAGIMGQVINVFDRTARVMLLSDKQHAVSVKIQRTGQRAILSGTGDASSLELQFLPNTADIQVGDRIVTTGLDGRFMAGFMVGRVSHVEHENQQEFSQVQVLPAARLGDPAYVLLHEPPVRPVMRAPVANIENSPQTDTTSEAQAVSQTGTEATTSQSAAADAAQTSQPSTAAQ